MCADGGWSDMAAWSPDLQDGRPARPDLVGTSGVGVSLRSSLRRPVVRRSGGVSASRPGPLHQPPRGRLVGRCVPTQRPGGAARSKTAPSPLPCLRARPPFWPPGVGGLLCRRGPVVLGSPP
jgi:hypothetical protein